MTDFVRDGAAQNYGEFELGVISLGKTHHVLVVDTGKDGIDRKTENRVLKFILDVRRKYPQPHVCSFDRFLTRSLFINGRLPSGTIQPDCTQPRPAENSISLFFGLRQYRGRRLGIVVYNNRELRGWDWSTEGGLRACVPKHA